ncbi:MAG TPA: cbb3-type cytochrome c oxidase subunit 3 [Planctomycetaceae bacterium]|nr:cbb3-type cytochrome c oxidase subunit 3 [Planctomycetaceae bacterium]
MPDLGTLRGVITLLTLVTFLGICWWAYRPGNRERFEEDGWLAFDDEGPASMSSVASGREGDEKVGENQK